ncbi:MFS transporter, partial [Klebsiella pneumoniae]
INNIALGTLPPARMKNASGLFNLTRNLGGAVGLAIINTLLSQRTDDHYFRIAEHVNFGNPAALEWLNTVGANYDSYGMDGTSVAVKKLVGVVSQQAWLQAFADVFLALTVLFSCLIFLTVLIKKPKAAPPPGAEH